MSFMLLAQPADEADGLPVLLAEEQLHLLHVTRALWQGLGALGFSALSYK